MPASISSEIKEKLSEIGVRVPEIYVPANGIDPKIWSVVACDQYTSDPRYWNELEAAVGNKPSTLRLTLPEIYLESPDVSERIEAICENMKSYEENKTVVSLGQTIVYVERTTELSGLRQGMMVALDLEKYDFAPDSKTLIRATEGTIVDRIPPRLRVRSRARFELPHIMVLVDDPECTLLEALGQKKGNFTPLVDTQLDMGGGTLRTWAIQDEKTLAFIAERLRDLHKRAVRLQKTGNPLLFAMGDGNHSLATAKAHWESVKKARPELNLANSLDEPARYALVEIVNIHSSGLRFEPIHRAVFTPSPKAYVETIRKLADVLESKTCDERTLKEFLGTPEGQHAVGTYDGTSWELHILNKNSSKLPPAAADGAFELHKKTTPGAKIDFIHGWEDTKKLTKEGAAAVFLPVIARSSLIPWVESNGPLPRKAFSMGDAMEKRYYFELRKIIR